MEIRWQVENNAYCRRVLAKHWPHVPCYGDIKSIDWHTVEPVDLVCGGFPCQPFSVAGKRRGAADDRYLWPEVVRCLDALRPTWFFGENVPGIINMALDQVCADLEGLGYEVWPVCIPACAVDAPHIRQRIWILAHASGIRCESHGKVYDGQHTRPHPACPYASPSGEVVAHPIQLQRDRWSDGVSWWEREPEETLCTLGGNRREEDGLSIPESLLGRVADGVPARMDRLRGLGNAVVPQIVEALGRMILEAEVQGKEGR